MHMSMLDSVSHACGFFSVNDPPTALECSADTVVYQQEAEFYVQCAFILVVQLNLPYIYTANWHTRNVQHVL